jgi:hypothetical protein
VKSTSPLLQTVSRPGTSELQLWRHADSDTRAEAGEQKQEQRKTGKTGNRKQEQKQEQEQKQGVVMTWSPQRQHQPATASNKGYNAPPYGAPLSVVPHLDYGAPPPPYHRLQRHMLLPPPCCRATCPGCRGTAAQVMSSVWPLLL